MSFTAVKINRISRGAVLTDYDWAAVDSFSKSDPLMKELI